MSINIDTTTSTGYGKIQGAYKRYNPKPPGKEGLRPVLCFIHETREYLCGTQRRGKRITGQEIARQILSFRCYLPDGVKSVLIRGDGEFIGREAVRACRERGHDFIFANRQCKALFEEEKWVKLGASRSAQIRKDSVAARTTPNVPHCRRLGRRAKNSLNGTFLEKREQQTK